MLLSLKSLATFGSFVFITVQFEGMKENSAVRMTGSNVQLYL